MSMTLEEARIELQAMKDTFEEYEPGGSRGQMALKVALSALRPVSRERVERMFRGCEVCKGAKYVTGSVSAVAPHDDQHEIETDAEGDFDFCPVCGRPLTDEAVEMVMERLEELSNGKG